MIADGEVVWSWRPDAGAKFARCKFSRGDGGKKAGHRGELEVSRKPLRREGRIASAEPVCSCALSFVHFAHETAGAARTRSSLRPLVKKAREFDCKPRTHRAARMRTRIPSSSSQAKAGRSQGVSPRSEADDKAIVIPVARRRWIPACVRAVMTSRSVGGTTHHYPACNLTKRSPPWSPSSRSAAPECASRSPAETAATGP